MGEFARQFGRRDGQDRALGVGQAVTAHPGQDHSGDTSGELTALFCGRTHITGLRTGSNTRLRGTIGITSTGAVMINPAYELLDCAPRWLTRP